jgi:hypothetical protein
MAASKCQTLDRSSVTPSDNKRRIASSAVVAIVNALLAILAVGVARLSQSGVPGWVWAFALLYVITLGPVISVAVLFLATRDFSHGKRVQAVGGACVALATAVWLLGTMRAEF